MIYFVLYSFPQLLYNNDFLYTKIYQYIIIFDDQYNLYNIFNTKTKKFSNLDDPFDFLSSDGFSVLDNSILTWSKKKIIIFKFN
jgi:hypothetical protein